MLENVTKNDLKRLAVEMAAASLQQIYGPEQFLKAQQQFEKALDDFADQLQKELSLSNPQKAERVKVPFDGIQIPDFLKISINE
jgi:hypothetical protein